MDSFRFIDQYCERIGPGLFAEPLNFATNLSFILAAWLTVRRLESGSTDRDHPVPLKVLILSAYAIGIGSALFHSVAKQWSMWADVLPIMFFLLFYLGVYLRRLTRCGWPAVAAGFLLFFALTATFSLLIPGSMVNGSQHYFGACCALFFMAPLASAQGLRSAYLFALAGGVFAVSLAFRSLDEAVCANFPWGTHFLWHILNGVVVYLALRVAVDNVERLAPEVARQSSG